MPIPTSQTSAPIPSSDLDIREDPTAPLGPAARTTLGRWLTMTASGDFSDLDSIIAAEAVYHSPVEWHPMAGRDLG